MSSAGVRIIDNFEEFLKEKTKKLIFSDRRFLNLPDSDDTGTIDTVIKHTSGYSKDSEGYVTYRMGISDCSRKIELNFEGDSVSNRENSMHKIDNLIEAMQEFKKGLIEAYKVEAKIEALEKERKRIEKEKENKEKAEEDAKKD